MRANDVLIIGGLGRVGLPLGLVFAEAGSQVMLHDVDTEKRGMVAEGKMPFLEEGAEELLTRYLGNGLEITDDLARVADVGHVIIAIGTPLDEYLNPRLLDLHHLAERLVPHLTPDHLVTLRSTVFPGSTRGLLRVFADLGAEVQVAYCPERIVEGHAIRELGAFPQIVSGSTPAALERAHSLFRLLGVKTIGVSLEEAELAKLFSNAWRYIQFGIANQFYMMSAELGADFDRVFHAMTEGYDRARSLPRPGFAAGPCLLKDTLQLAATTAGSFLLGHAAMQVNEGLPGFLVRMLADHHGVDLSTATVGILGMAFKADIDDVRDSLSYKLAKCLRFAGATVLGTDPHVTVDPNLVALDEVLDRSDAIVVAVPHAAYRDLPIPEGTKVLDLWRVLAPGA